MNLKSIAALLAVSTVLGGCSTNQTKEIEPLDTNKVMSAFSQDLLVIAQDIRSANKQTNLLLLEKHKMTTAQSPKELAKRDIPKGLDKKITINWPGEPEKLVSLIAQLIGYTYLPAEGKKPITPMTVSINVIEAQAYHVLRDVGIQMGDKAMLVIDPSNQTLQISYLGR